MAVKRNVLTPRGKIRRLRILLRKSVKERDSVIDGMLSALIAGEHVFIGGPPGTAKTWLAEMLNSSLKGATYFYWLLTRFSTPEELFGPHSLQGLKADRFERVITKKLPEAHIAFLDEIFKANSAILNSLLTLINERRFHNGTSVIDCPLTMLIGASNELPQGSELEALFDRFLLRYWVGPIADRDELRDMLSGAIPAPTVKISMLELRSIQTAAKDIEFSGDMLDLLLDVKDALGRDGFTATDRRWKKIISVLRAYAYLQNAKQVSEDHFSILADMLWREPKDRPALVKAIAKIANPVGAEAIEVLDACKEAFRTLPMNLDDVDVTTTVNAIIDANTVFVGSLKKLRNLTERSASGQLTSAIKQIVRWHKEASRFAAKLQGLTLQ